MTSKDFETLGYVVQYAINPEMRVTRREIFSFIVCDILMTCRTQPVDANTLKSAIVEKYGIELPDLTLEQTLDRLQKDRIIEGRISPEKTLEHATRIIFAIDQQSEAVTRYKQAEDKYNSKLKEIEDWFFAQLSKYYKSELDANEKQILWREFLKTSHKITAKLAQDIRARTGDDKPAYWDDIFRLESEMKPSLAEAVYEVYDDLWHYRGSPVANAYLNLAVFWNIFISVLPYRSKIRDFLLQKAKEFKLYLDTNVLISGVCHYDPFHYATKRFLSYLQRAKIDLYYTSETRNELEQSLRGARDVVAVLDTYPDEYARAMARKIGNGMVMGYFEEKYRGWGQYYKHFMSDLAILPIDFKSTSEIINKYKLDTDSIMKPKEKLMQLFAVELQKVGGIALHDAILLNLVRSIREKTRIQGMEWYSHWILTLDMKLRDKDQELTTSEGEAQWPVCIHVAQIPLIFEPYALAESVIDDTNSIEFDVLDSLQAISVIPTESKGLSLADALDEVKTEEDLRDQLVKHLRKMCWEPLKMSEAYVRF